MALLSIDEGLEFSLSTIKGAKYDTDYFGEKGVYIKLSHSSNGEFEPFIYDSELQLLLSLLELQKDKMIEKKVTTVSCGRLLLAIGHNDKYFRLYRDGNDCLDQSQPLQLLSREELCTALGNFNVHFIGRDGREVADITKLDCEGTGLATSHITPKK